MFTWGRLTISIEPFKWWFNYKACCSCKVVQFLWFEIEWLDDECYEGFKKVGLIEKYPKVYFKTADK